LMRLRAMCAASCSLLSIHLSGDGQDTATSDFHIFG
jgi:hypothetical protein